MKTVIYTLEDPVTGDIRYIGKTRSSLKYRLSQHIHDSLNNGTKTRKKAWIKGLILQGLLPVIQVLDVVDNDDWKLSEQYWISQLKAWGFKLTNMTAGGDGNQKMVMSEESKQKRSAALKGRKRPKEVTEKISKAHLGKKLLDSTKEKIRLFNLGKKQSEETRRKRYKPVILVDAYGNILKEYPSLQHAALQHGCRRGQIANVCAGRTKSACGLIWKYKDLEDIV